VLKALTTTSLGGCKIMRRIPRPWWVGETKVCLIQVKF